MINISEEEICKNWKNTSSKPFVSICTTSYNHEKLLHEALDSFLMQKTNFSFEIVIDEDCSVDNTKEVIREYAEKYPRIFNVNLRKKNVGIVQNFEENALRANGKYIAMCEGDDYWTSDVKLQTQIDFLEEHPEYNACFHDSLNLYIDKNGQKITSSRIGSRKIDEDVHVQSLIYENNIPTASIVYRNTIKKFSKYFLETSKVDYALMLMIAERGPIKYLPHLMAVYRLHDGGIWSLKAHDYHAREGVKFYKLLAEHFKDDKKVMQTIDLKMKNEYFNLAIALMRQKKRLSSLKYLIKSLGDGPTHKNTDYVKYLKASLKSFV